MKQLQPITVKDSYYKDIEKQLKLFFDELIYNKLFELINNGIGHYYNSDEAIKSALLKGQIQYVDGRFIGKFNAQISKELKDLGATWRESYFILKNLPADIMAIVAQASLMFTKLHKDILAVIYSIKPELLLKTFDFDTSYIKTLTDIDERLYNSLKVSISVIPDMSPEMREVIAEEYSTNLKLYIKDFTDQEILTLRQLVEDNMFNQGARAENLVKIIKKRYGVSENKAKFLAKQETSLLTADFRNQRYLECGVTTWKWSTSHDSRVRPLHKDLDKKVFKMGELPIIDEKGNKGLPGQTFGCRCVQVPMIE